MAGFSHFNPAMTRDSTALIDAPQNFTLNWEDLGPVLPTMGMTTAALWVTVDINNTQNARFRVIGKKTVDDVTDYPLPILDVAATVIGVEPNLCELTTDADQSIVIGFEIDNAIPWIQFQTQAGVLGVSVGNVASAYYSLGSR